MNPIYLVLGLGILALLLLSFFAVFRGKGKFTVKTKLGEASAEGENPPPATTVAKGVKVSGKAGRDIRAHSTGEGGVDVAAEAGGNIHATHKPETIPPK